MVVMPEIEDKNSQKKPEWMCDTAYVNAMAHFYRGELGRIMVWRQRLDTTTTWAITSTGTIFTVAFSFRDVPHIIFFFNLAIVTMMLWIEARRYRYYDAFRARVRMLEAHFLVPIILQREEPLPGDWRKLVCEDLLLPAFKISMFEAIGRRLKRNYMFIYIIILNAWCAKIFLHAPRPISSFYDLYLMLGVGQIPRWFIAGIMLGTFLCVIAVSVYIARKSSDEMSELATQNRNLWRL